MKINTLLALIGTSSAINFSRFNGRPIALVMADPGVATKWGPGNPHPGFEISDSGFIGSEAKGAYTREAPSNF